jgi:hypothetical protein
MTHERRLRAFRRTLAETVLRLSRITADDRERRERYKARAERLRAEIAMIETAAHVTTGTQHIHLKT